MSAPGFSPAPWRIHPDSDGGFSVVEIIAHNNTQVAQLEIGTPDDGPITEADARLIAAAPEMYAALERCIALFGEIRGDWTDPREECREGMAVARAALAKATGGAL